MTKKESFTKQAQILLVGIAIIIALCGAILISWPAQATKSVNIAFNGAEQASINCMGSKLIMDRNTLENGKTKISVPYPDNKISCLVRSTPRGKSIPEASINGHIVAVSSEDVGYRFTFATDSKGDIKKITAD